MLLAAVVNSIRSVDSEEMRGEIERMKGSDALTEAILEFGKVCSEVRCAVHMGSHQLSSRVFCVYLVICECSWWLQPADTTATAVRDAPPPPAPQEFPGLVRPLLHERDEYLAYMLRKLPAHGCTVVVAVVGAGHLQGIRWVGGWRVGACLLASKHACAGGQEVWRHASERYSCSVCVHAFDCVQGQLGAGDRHRRHQQHAGAAAAAQRVALAAARAAGHRRRARQLGAGALLAAAALAN